MTTIVTYTNFSDMFSLIVWFSSCIIVVTPFFRRMASLPCSPSDSVLTCCLFLYPGLGLWHVVLVLVDKISVGPAVVVVAPACWWFSCWFRHFEFITQVIDYLHELSLQFRQGLQGRSFFSMRCNQLGKIIGSGIEGVLVCWNCDTLLWLILEEEAPCLVICC